MKFLIPCLLGFVFLSYLYCFGILRSQIKRIAALEKKQIGMLGQLYMFNHHYEYDREILSTQDVFNMQGPRISVATAIEKEIERREALEKYLGIKWRCGMKKEIPPYYEKTRKGEL